MGGEPSRRQICWAHLLRDFQSWVDAGGVGALWDRRCWRKLTHCFTSTTDLKLELALWTFVSMEGVEPTNHCAEHALRHAVL